jgi:hypothetical protein
VAGDYTAGLMLTSVLDTLLAHREDVLKVGLCFAVGIAMAGGAAFARWDDERFRETAETAQAVVVGTEEYCDDERGCETHVRIRFATLSGSAAEARILDQKLMSPVGLREGDAVAVLYHADDPANARFARPPLGGGELPAGLALGCAFAFLYALTRQNSKASTGTASLPAD